MANFQRGSRVKEVEPKKISKPSDKLNPKTVNPVGSLFN